VNKKGTKTKMGGDKEEASFYSVIPLNRR